MSAAPNTAPHAARAMPLHPRASGIQTAAGAALNVDDELNEPGEADDAEADDEGSAAVDAKESVTLSIEQNRWARVSADGTFVPQPDATQAYSAAANVLFWW
jgi:hypothetical protein